MKLIPLSEHPYAEQVLWDLLEQRPAENNISHRVMPSWETHCRFVAENPYEHWAIIDVDGTAVGAIYLSKPGGPSVSGNEIGIDLFSAHQGKGLGTQAVKLLMDQFGPRRYMANVAPGNEASQGLFQSLGFKLVQFTYATEAE